MSRLAPYRLILVAVLASPSCMREVVAPVVPEVASMEPPAATSARDDLLAGADSVTMEVTLSGCFHFSRHRLVFVPDSMGAVVRRELLQSGPQPIVRPDVAEPQLVDAATLHGLTRLLEHYRQPGRLQGCTSSVAIEMVTHVAGATPQRERMFDASCTEHEVSGAVSLWQVIDGKRSS